MHCPSVLWSMIHFGWTIEPDSPRWPGYNWAWILYLYLSDLCIISFNSFRCLRGIYDSANWLKVNLTVTLCAYMQSSLDSNYMQELWSFDRAALLELYGICYIFQNLNDQQKNLWIILIVDSSTYSLDIHFQPAMDISDRSFKSSPLVIRMSVNVKT